MLTGKNSQEDLKKLENLKTNISPKLQSVFYKIALDMSILANHIEPVFTRYSEQMQKIARTLEPTFTRYNEQIQKIAKTLEPALTGYNEQIQKIAKTLEPALTGYSEQMQKIAKTLEPTFTRYNEQIQKIAKTLEPAFTRYNEQIQKIAKTLEPAFTRYSEQIQELSKTFNYAYKYHFPDNWGNKITIDYVDLCKSGFPIIFIPNSKILDKVIKAKTFSLKKTVLCKNDQTIINDCENAIKECKCLNKDIKAHIISSILSYKNKNYRSAQSSATIVFDCLLEYIIDVKVIRKLQNNKKKLASNVVSKIKIIDFDKLSFSKVPFYTILMIPIINNALKLFAIGDKNTFVNEYNRHMSIHTVSSIQYKRSNALIAIMLITNICVITDKLGKNWLGKTAKMYGIDVK